jgi:hypothetical protein
MQPNAVHGNEAVFKTGRAQAGRSGRGSFRLGGENRHGANETEQSGKSEFHAFKSLQRPFVRVKPLGAARVFTVFLRM